MQEPSQSLGFLQLENVTSSLEVEAQWPREGWVGNLCIWQVPLIVEVRVLESNPHHLQEKLGGSRQRWEVKGRGRGRGRHSWVPWCAKSHTAADGLSYTWVTSVVSSQEASGVKITQCSSAHVKDSSEQKNIGCFIFPYAPHAFSSPLPLLPFLVPLSSPSAQMLGRME